MQIAYGLLLWKKWHRHWERKYGSVLFDVLIRLLGKKFKITEDEKTAVRNIKNGDVLDKAIDAVLFAETKQEDLGI